MSNGLLEPELWHVPETYMFVPETYMCVPETYMCVPETYMRVLETYMCVLETYCICVSWEQHLRCHEDKVQRY